MDTDISPLQTCRQTTRLSLPSMLHELEVLSFCSESHTKPSSKLEVIFPHLSDKSVLRAVKGEKKRRSPLKIGVVLSGGQAAGGHNVITGLFDAMQRLSPGSVLYGFLDGPSGIVKGLYEELDSSRLDYFRNQGGFDLLGSGRTKIETQEQMASSLKVVRDLELDGLVVIGGDDSNTNAALLSEYFLSQGSSTKVVGVPKTIDGDLQNDHVAISFGFDSACKVYSELIGNIERDALSAKKYYHFIKLMGRTASHITLECALATHPNYALIGEEVAYQGKTLMQIVTEISDMVVQRAEKGKQYGVVLVPEGLIEFIPEMRTLIQELNAILGAQEGISIEKVVEKLTPGSKTCFEAIPESIQKQLLLVRDPHGNVQVSLIETEKLLIEAVTKELVQRKQKGGYDGKFNPIAHFFGYEGRSGFPSNFDAHYCYSLGMTAALLIAEGATGYMCFVGKLKDPVEEWEIGGVPLTSLMTIEMRKGKEKPVIEKALVKLDSPAFLFYKKNRDSWMKNDNYRFPGPTQYFGEKNICDSIPFIVSMGQG